MRIGIDVSQLAYKNTGVSNYLENLVDNLLKTDKKNEYVFFFSSLRKNLDSPIFNSQVPPRITLKSFKFPPTFLDLIWNKLHIIPIEWLIGKVDLFITSDWTEPPSKGKKATFIYDLTIYKTPKETHKKIILTQKRKLKWVKKESNLVFAISESGKKDIQEFLEIPNDKIKVIYPGI